MKKTLVPPKFNLSKEELDAWHSELVHLKEQVESAQKSEDVEYTAEWIRSQQRKYAPGFDSLDSIMHPNKKEN